MSGKFPTALHMVKMLRGHLRTGASLAGLREITPIERDAFYGLEAQRFDVTLPDGRIYRVRVSDISPPPDECVKEPA